MSEDIAIRVKEMLRDNLGDSPELEQLKPDEDLAGLGVNSVTFIKLVIAAEMEFGIHCTDEDMNYENFSTINNIVKFISRSGGN